MTRRSLAAVRPTAPRHTAAPPTEPPLTPVRALLVVCLVLAPLLFSVHLTEEFEEPKDALLESTALAVAAVALGGCLAGGRAGVLAAWAGLRRLVREPICLGVLLFVASAALSTWRSVSPLVSWRGDRDYPAGLRTLLADLVFFLAVRWAVRTAADGRRLLAAAVPAAVVAAAYGLVQPLGLDPIAWKAASQVGAFVRASGPLGHANLLGAFLAVTLPPLAAVALSAFRRGRAVRGVALALAAAPALAAAVLTLSRGAWLALAVG